MLQKLLNHFKKSISNPIFWFGLLLVIFSFNQFFTDEDHHVIRSDGRGYYAYLPAIITYNDASFESSVEAEQRYIGEAKIPHYLFKTENGTVQNKYFPGVAVLQTPFYLMATITSWISGQPINGYSPTFEFFFQLGSMFYVILGMILFTSLLNKLFPDQKKVLKWLIPALYILTPLFYYSTDTLSLSHLYSFFLFGLFANLILMIRGGASSKLYLLLGIVLGLVALVRPTNVLIVLIIPFLLQDRSSLFSFIGELFRNKAKKFLLGTVGFLAMIAIVFVIWKWESGKWFVWGYGGEGFNFLKAQIYASLFSFRVGLFLQTPVLFLSIIGLIYLFRSNKFQAFWWLLYFVVNVWVISSWWCWDYESAFGNRPYTEHLIFMILPLMFLLQKRLKLALPILGLLFIVGLIRITAYNSGSMTIQRFTKSNYLSSLAFWNESNFDRWNYTRSCQPFGEKINETTLFERAEEFNVTSKDIYLCGGRMELHQPRTNERFYYRVELEKRVSDVPLENVSLVIDASNSKTGELYYLAVPLYNDKLEGLNSWAPLVFEGQILDNFQKYDQLKIYIWNRDGKEFELRNVKVVMEEYKS